MVCLEGVAYRNGWIWKRKCEGYMLKNQYELYLLKYIDEMNEENNSGTLEHV
jgi:hypothetical protein